MSPSLPSCGSASWRCSALYPPSRASCRSSWRSAHGPSCHPSRPSTRGCSRCWRPACSVASASHVGFRVERRSGDGASWQGLRSPSSSRPCPAWRSRPWRSPMMSPFVTRPSRHRVSGRRPASDSPHSVTDRWPSARPRGWNCIWPPRWTCVRSARSTWPVCGSGATSDGSPTSRPSGSLARTGPRGWARPPGRARRGRAGRPSNPPRSMPTPWTPRRSPSP